MRIVEGWVLSYVLNSLWQAPLLLAAGWVGARLVRRLGAAAEHRVWVGVLGLQSTLPALTSLPWEWLRALWPWGGAGAAGGAGRVTVEMGAGMGWGGWHAGAGWMDVAALVYGAGTAYFVARFAWRCAHLAVLRRDARELTLTGDAAREWSRWMGRMGARRVTLATSARIAAPVTMGTWRRLVLLPERMAQGLAETEFSTVIAHELAHIERNDFAKNLGYELLALPVSYHPLLQVTRARIAETREMVCDALAAEANGALEYGRSLLRLAALVVAGPAGTPHALGIFDANTLERRLMRLKNRQSEVKGGRRAAMLLGCAVLAAVTCASAAALHVSVDAAAAPDTRGAKAIHVAAGVMAGNVVSKVAPKYPVEAKKKRIQGTVRLEAVISKAGDVDKLTVVSGPKELQKSSLDAVRQWKYKPFLLNGNPVEVDTTITVIYSLAK